MTFPQNVEIIRSKKRKKTIQSKFINGKYIIYLPCGLSKAEEEKWILKMIDKHKKSKRRKTLNDDGLLQKRAKDLNKLYFDSKLEFSIKFVTNQNSRFGSCSTISKKIRISDRVAEMPKWVGDYIIIHELAHLVYPNHSKNFWKKVNEYKYSERARGYLIALGFNSDED